MQTSLTVASCLYCLATNTEVQEKLRNEVQEVVGKEQMVTSEHVQNMHYLRDCIKETTRLNMVYLITILYSETSKQWTLWDQYKLFVPCIELVPFKRFHVH